jgi:hypothetical protein
MIFENKDEYNNEMVRQIQNIRIINLIKKQHNLDNFPIDKSIKLIS